MENRLEGLIGVKNEAISEKIKNNELIKDLNEVNRLAKRADFEKKKAVEAVDYELSEAKVKINFKKYIKKNNLLLKHLF